MYHLISQLRNTWTFFHCWCVRHIGSHSLQTDQPKCFTLQGQSLECYSRHKTFYKSLQYSTNEKLSSWHLVCHAFLSMTFAFCSCSRSVEALNCLSDWRKTKKNMENLFEYLMKTKNQMLNHIKSANWNEQSNPIQSGLMWSRIWQRGIVHIAQGHIRLF